MSALLADSEAEQALLGACLLSEDALRDVIDRVAPSDFQRPQHEVIFEAIIKVFKSGSRPDEITVHRAIRDVEVPLTYLGDLTRLTPMISNARFYADRIQEAKLRSRLTAAHMAAGQVLGSEPDALLAHERIIGIFADVARPSGLADPVANVREFMASVDTRYDWLVENFLERGDRMVVTAAEGAGKTVLLNQLAVMIAAGVHPWNYRPSPPRNVLMVDLENSARLVTRRLEHLVRQAGQGFDPDRLRVCCSPEGINLTAPVGRQWLVDRCRDSECELLVIGPVYRMYAGASTRGDVGGEDQIRSVTAAIDELRDRFGIAVVLEAHAPHAHAGGRDLRPFGSSVWLRWPEFGIGLAADQNDPDRFEVTHWRGPRDVRIWPQAVRRGAGRWMWTPEGMPTGSFRDP